MDLGTLLVLLLVLACPLGMLLMHRGGGHAHGSAGPAADKEHAGHGCGHDGHAGHGSGEHGDSIDELRRRRDELDAEIAEREQTVEPLPR